MFGFDPVCGWISCEALYFLPGLLLAFWGQPQVRFCSSSIREGLLWLRVWRCRPSQPGRQGKRNTGQLSTQHLQTRCKVHNKRWDRAVSLVVHPLKFPSYVTESFYICHLSIIIWPHPIQPLNCWKPGKSINLNMAIPMQWQQRREAGVTLYAPLKTEKEAS